MAEEEQKKQSVVIPVYKKKGFWIAIAVILVLGFFYNLGTSNKEDLPDENEQSQTANSDGAEAGNSDSEYSDRIGGDGIVCATDKVRNDVTGNWRIVTIAKPLAMSEKAVEYYNECFKSDNEIHAIVNFTYKTTTKISSLGDNTINVTTYEYVSGEEHDAKKLFSGMLLTDKFYDATSGKELEL